MCLDFVLNAERRIWV